MQYDKDFLLKLDKVKNKTIFARITALTFNELPVETIEGRVTQGSVNIDGDSAVRRTCSLTIVAQDFDYSDYYWGMNTKFKLEVGVKNNIDESYPDIIWFPQGIYLITSFNTSRSTNNFSISIQGKDKMCLLNGEIGGSLDSSVDFGVIEEEDKDGVWRIRKIPIPDIIRNAVHTYGGEPYHNIIINDLDTYGLELLEYRYNKPMYLYRTVNENGEISQIYTNATLEGSQICKVGEEEKTLDELNSSELEMLVDTLVGSNDGVNIEIEDKVYRVAKINQGDTAGYRQTELTYAGDLIANVGESITSVLDKIKTMLVEFEYFYDLDGRFIFQKKQSFISTMWSPSSEGSESLINEQLAAATTHAYMFNSSELITAFNNNPNLLNLRNDFSVWGQKNTISGATVPIHLRYAIHEKPKYYKQIMVPEEDPQVVEYNRKYGTTLPFQPAPLEFKIEDWDWREIIYQMALDYYRYNILEDFELRVAESNYNYYPLGRTGYENYYIDLQGFWRLLYNPNLSDEILELENQIQNLEREKKICEEHVYGTGNESGSLSGGLEKYYTSLYEASEEDFEKIIEEFNIWNDKYEQYEDINLSVPYSEALLLLKAYYDEASLQLDTINTELVEIQQKYEDKIEEKDGYYSDGKYKYWNKDVYQAPETLTFWFDFLDTNIDSQAENNKQLGSELDKFKVEKIGARSKSINDTAVNCIYFRETPNVIFQTKEDKIYKEVSLTEETFVTNVYYIYVNNEYILSPFFDANLQYYEYTYPDPISGFKYIQIPGYDNMFSISGRGKSAKERLDELLYQHSYCIESATITTIPIYYLQPNTRIYVYDNDTKLNGDYIVSKITVPLTHNGTMQLTATKAAQDII